LVPQPFPTPLRQFLGASNKAECRWPKRSWKTAVVNRNRNVKMVGRAFK
jgi:hypothetical protein